ncbi:helix-hairpin-helix domain-containing protein [Amphibacillus jilinensis]|uniref:helix-hairpin-helix domain-containing protein n=1 Tax=Amphibacillus jilinensis TaxID=1216008 RepID=UPI0003166127|nr:helix-hairpin-helix domain-containing protein [Amphibacillus jilinensis]
MKWIKQNVIMVIVCLFLLITLISELLIPHFFSANASFDTPKEPQTVETELLSTDKDDISPSSDQSSKTNDTLYVDIKGEIEHPGVYSVEEDDRVVDVIDYAGGLKADADEKQINLAEKVHDEMVIIVPHVDETENFIPTSGESHDKIKINTATQTDLEQLPGIGEAKAQAIIKYREENGAFQSLEDMQNVSGIGEKTVSQLAEFIIVP